MKRLRWRPRSAEKRRNVARAEAARDADDDRLAQSVAAGGEDGLGEVFPRGVGGVLDGFGGAEQRGVAAGAHRAEEGRARDDRPGGGGTFAEEEGVGGARRGDALGGARFAGVFGVAPGGS